MYLGQYHLDLDKDYRMVVPAGFRELFAQGAYITRGFEQNLLVMSERDFQERCKQVAALNITDPNARLLQRLLLGNAVRLEINASGQVLLPSELMAFAGLEKEIILVGQGDYFECLGTCSMGKTIRHPARYRRQCRAVCPPRSDFEMKHSQTLHNRPSNKRGHNERI